MRFEKIEGGIIRNKWKLSPKIGCTSNRFVQIIPRNIANLYNNRIVSRGDGARFVAIRYGRVVDWLRNEIVKLPHDRWIISVCSDADRGIL